MTRVHYVLSMPRPCSHLLHVRMEIRGVPPGPLDLALPSWIPGSYRIRDFARHVQDFSAGGRRWEKTAKNRWRVFGGGDATVSYRVWAFERSVHASHLDDEHAFVNGAGVFLYADGCKDAPVTLEVRAPRGWRIATGLERRGRLFTAPDYDALVDCPLEIGTFALHPFRVRGVPHRLAIHGRWNGVAAVLARDLRRIAETAIRVMGEMPCRDYLFILHEAADRAGGLEHRNSCALQQPPPGGNPQERYENLLELAAHEYFHLWNAKRLRPAELGPFDYEREVHTRLLWATEGWTSYYSELLLCRSGILPPARYLRRLAERIRKYEGKPGRRRQSLSEASFDAWIKLYQPNENALNSQVSYYEKGALAGLCLDLEIRRRTGGRRSLDDVLRRLYEACRLRGRGLEEPEFRRICREAAGLRLDRFFADFVDGTTDISWNRFLGAAGLRLAKEPAGDGQGKTRAWLGVSVRKSGGALQIESVIEGSPADRAGLSARDEIIAWNGLRLDPTDLRSLALETLEGTGSLSAPGAGPLRGDPGREAARSPGRGTAAPRRPPSRRIRGGPAEGTSPPPPRPRPRGPGASPPGPPPRAGLPRTGPGRPGPAPEPRSPRDATTAPPPSLPGAGRTGGRARLPACSTNGPTPSRSRRRPPRRRRGSSRRSGPCPGCCTRWTASSGSRRSSRTGGARCRPGTR